MASADSLDATPQPTPRAVALHRIKHVLAAGGLEPAVPADEWAECNAVQEYHSPDHGGQDGVDELHGQAYFNWNDVMEEWNDPELR